MHRASGGFTLIELLITMIVMVVLLALGVVATGSVQTNARDSERKADIAAIARGLEQRYVRGNSTITAVSSNDQTAKKGYYPSVYELIHIEGQNVSSFTPSQVSGGYVPSALSGVTNENIATPNGGSLVTVCTSGSSCASADDYSQLNAAINGSNGSDNYVYIPLASDGTVCKDGACTHFVLYWKSESDQTVKNGIAGLQSTESRHQ